MGIEAWGGAWGLWAGLSTKMARKVGGAYKKWVGLKGVKGGGA